MHKELLTMVHLGGMDRTNRILCSHKVFVVGDSSNNQVRNIFSMGLYYFICDWKFNSLPRIALTIALSLHQFQVPPIPEDDNTAFG